MIKLNMPIVVEGKYDKIRLSSYIDALIIETDGFRVFSNDEKKNLIKRLAKENGIIVMTDSDAAGFKIRNFICNIAKDCKVINVYIPDIFGKEKRKTEPSKEGKLGVEGMNEEIIMTALEKAGVTATETMISQRRLITNADLFEDGLSGGENSRERRYEFLKKVGLPCRISGGRMLQILNTFMTYEQYKTAVSEINVS